MGKYAIYTVFGILIVVYLFITLSTKRSSNRRKDRKFMEDRKRRKERKE